MDKYYDNNRNWWNDVAEINYESDMYDVEGFLQGKSSLHDIEREEIGGYVEGKSLLHLQCHFGMDTLSFARMGAQVTGVDFSEKAIDLARRLNEKLGLSARFIHANICELGNHLQDRFDIVYTSYGVLCWLDDIQKWAEIISHYLKPGGLFYIVEFHPLLNVFDNESDSRELKIAYSYFHDRAPMEWSPDYAYADETKMVKYPSFEWRHTLGDIVTALIRQGLEPEFLHEFPYCIHKFFAFMQKDENGYWRTEGADLPYMFSLRARKK